MGRSVAQGQSGFSRVGSSDAFYGGKAPILPNPFASNAPSTGGQKTLPMAGAPTVPPNPYADTAWRAQKTAGAMGAAKINSVPWE